MLPTPKDFKLTTKQRTDVQKIIDTSPPGRFTLRQLFGKERWLEIGDNGKRREYGARFVNSYENNDVHGLIMDGDKSHSVAYVISK